MLISPPFLPIPIATENDEAYIDRAMTGDAPGSGGFPISFQLGWHGGLHLAAPDAGASPVRAIADGKVVFKRNRTNVPAPADDQDKPPLYYGSGYTSDGCVVLEHTTDIGADSQGAPVTIKFYSIYLHLHTINVRANQVIYRKDSLGQAGHIYGTPGLIHFEIICDDQNLQLMMGREPGAMLETSGRTDAVFGSTYFRIPAGTPVYAENPQTATRTYAVQRSDTATSLAQMFSSSVSKLKQLNNFEKKTDAEFDISLRAKGNATGTNKNIKVPAPYITPVANITSVQQLSTTKEDMVVQLTYVQGRASFKSLHVGGSPLNDQQPHASITENGSEYDMFKTATARYATCASAGYELLRFGRILGTDALHPDDIDLQAGRHVHFRKVNFLNADENFSQGFIDLNAPNVQISSSADMPLWEQWWIVKDADDGNSRCDSSDILNMLDDSCDGKVTAAEAHTQLAKPEIQSRLKKIIGKFSTEWEKGSIEKRWGWLKQDKVEDYAPTLSECMNDESFGKLTAHLEALSFWEDVQTKIGLSSLHWHFEPREFIKHFRKCGWLSTNEFSQCIPREQLHLHANQFRLSSTSWNLASSRATLWKTAFNKATRKYGVGLSKFRLIHFFAHVIPETGNLQFVKC
jgi:murein DD-endopeptidase MepM/ murein hydrolase activator NlpD